MIDVRMHDISRIDIAYIWTSGVMEMLYCITEVTPSWLGSDERRRLRLLADFSRCFDAQAIADIELLMKFFDLDERQSLATW